MADDTGGGWDPIGGIGDALNGVGGAVGFWTDPWGNTFSTLRDAAKSLSSDLLPQLTSATLPDLTLDWFVSAYQVSFAAAIFCAVVLLFPQIIRTARGAQSGRDLMESLGLYFPLFLIGAMFGPGFGVLLVRFFHSLSESFATWGITSTVDEVNARFSVMLDETDPLAIAGGVPVAALLMLLMVLGLFFVLLVLIVQLVTLYFTGVLIPLALVWIIDPTKRTFGLRLVGIWVGILAAHPLLFFLLGFAFTMLGGSIDFLGNNASLQKLVQLIVAVIAMFIAALSPLLLMKFAPVIPMGFGGTSGPALAGAGSWGPSSYNDAINRYSPQSSSSSASAPSTVSSVSETSEVAGSGSSGGLSAAATKAAGSGGAAAGGAAAGGAEAAEVGLAAAGTAETATGVGAAIGVPTLLAAGAVTAGSAAVSLTQAAGDQAIAAMDEPEGGN